MVQHCDVTEVEIDGRSFMVRPVGSWVLESGNVVAKALAVSLDKPLPRVSSSSSATPNLVWNCERGLRVIQGLMIGFFECPQTLDG
tara:strand:- start:111 stop:368 length:258 start_codon:yes stop_codon:yes gene_type:complete